ncbi:MAG: hypothetical protein INR73_21985 [Williamsia sp.]|nr:hypothetical protein [Williamsia sp.]
MEQETKMSVEGQNTTDEIKKNKGGRPKGQRDYSDHKVTCYLTEEEYKLLTEFAKTSCYTYGYSGAVRRLVLEGLKGWMKKGKKQG